MERLAAIAEPVSLLKPRFRRFRHQLLLLVVGLLAAVQIAVYLAVSAANERNALAHIAQNLETGARLFRQDLQARVSVLTEHARLISGDYALRPLLMRDADAATLRSALRSYSQRLGDLRIGLFTPEGNLQAMTDESLEAADAGPFHALISLAGSRDADQASGYAYLAGRLQVLVVVPLYAPEPDIVAWFGLAYPIDEVFAQSIKNTTLLEVSFTTGPDAVPPRVLSSTLPTATAAALTRPVAAAVERGGHQVVSLNGEPYVTLYEALPLIGAPPARIVLQRSLNAELAPARDLERVVLAISLTALLVASLIAGYIARGVSEPLQTLTAHTRLVAAGDYTHPLELPRADEIGQLARAFNHMTAGLAERDRVRDLLGKVVSPEIATQLLASDLQLGGEEREVTILFCDLRNFTGLSERMPPTTLLALLNRYLDRMSAIIERHGGVIDKYIGDAIMALFGAPVALDHSADRAVAAAREMVAALAELNRELVSEGRPVLAFGIGINTASVVAGNMGSATRMNYTVIGDGVNLAARLESLTKEPGFATPILLSEATFLALRSPPATRVLGDVAVKGKREPVRVHALG